MNKTTEKRREKILNYVKNNRSDALHFSDERASIKKLEYTTLTDLIRQILRLSETYCSYTIDGIRETGYGRRRSSLDIWRHVKFFEPDVDIFTVMETLYGLRNELNGNYCWIVKRGVFTLRYSSSIYRSENFLSREYMITFNAWKCLH